MVTKVVHKSTAEIFAMKTITKKKVLEHKMTSYLTREVRTQIKVQHPNILRLVYYFEDAQNVYLLLEYAKGGSLFSVMRKRGHLPELEAAGLFVDVASALDHLHRNGIVHRDLKPENILMCDNVAKLADFGWCAELSKDGGLRHTFCGTWDYLSPEMVNNEPHDFTVDIWAMGVLLFEMLTGRPPFAAPSQMKAMIRITKVDLQIPDSVSTGASDIISKLIVKDKRRRLSLFDAVRHYWVTCYIPNAEQKVKKPAPAPEGPPPAAAGGGLSPSAKRRASADPGAPLAGWDCQPEPGVPVGWGGGKAPTAAPQESRTDRPAQEVATASPPTLGAVGVASPSTSVGAGVGAKQLPSSPGKGEARDARSANRNVLLGKELAHLPSPGSSLGSSLAPLVGHGIGATSKAAWPEQAEVVEPSAERRSGTENVAERPALPIASTMTAGPAPMKPSKLNDLIKKHLDAAGDTCGLSDVGAPSSASTSAGTSDAWRASPSPGSAGARLPAAGVAGLQSSALPEASLHHVAPELSQTQPVAVGREAEMESNLLAAVAPGALAAVPKDSPYSSQGSPTPDDRNRKELWQDTNTFAAIRKWVRKSSALTTPLGEELDKTLPVGAIEAGQTENFLSSSEGSPDLFSLPVTSGDQLAPLPKRRAANSKRRASGLDLTMSSSVQSVVGSTSFGLPDSGSSALKGDSLSSSSSASPVASALQGLGGGAPPIGSPGALAGLGAGGASALARGAVLAASPRTAPVPSQLVRDTPRLQEVKDLATRMHDLRSQIDRDLDSSCNALKQHFDHQDFRVHHPVWRDIEQVVVGKTTSLSDNASALLGRKQVDMAGSSEAADKAAGYTTQAAAADRAAGVAVVGLDTLSEIPQEKAGRTLCST